MSVYGINEIMNDPNVQAFIELKIYADSIMHIGVYGDESTNFSQDPYIKVYNAENPLKADKVARISLIHMKYIYHRDRYDTWYMNKKELKHLNKIMGTTVTETETYWDITLKKIAEKCNRPVEYYIKRIGSDIPDFTEVRR